MVNNVTTPTDLFIINLAGITSYVASVRVYILNESKTASQIKEQVCEGIADLIYARLMNY